MDNLDFSHLFTGERARGYQIFGVMWTQRYSILQTQLYLASQYCQKHCDVVRMCTKHSSGATNEHLFLASTNPLSGREDIAFATVD